MKFFGLIIFTMIALQQYKSITQINMPGGKTYDRNLGLLDWFDDDEEEKSNVHVDSAQSIKNLNVLIQLAEEFKHDPQF